MEPNQTDMSTSSPTPVTPSLPEKPKTSYGALLGLVVIVAAIALGALYFLNERVSENAVLEQNAALEAIDAQGTSTDAAAIEEDLDAQTPADFDAEIDAAFGDLDAEFETTQ